MLDLNTIDTFHKEDVVVTFKHGADQTRDTVLSALVSLGYDQFAFSRHADHYQYLMVKDRAARMQRICNGGLDIKLNQMAIGMGGPTVEDGLQIIPVESVWVTEHGTYYTTEVAIVHAQRRFMLEVAGKTHVEQKYEDTYIYYTGTLTDAEEILNVWVMSETKG